MLLSVTLIIAIIITMVITRTKILSPAGIQNCMWIFFIIGAFAILSKSYRFTYDGSIWILSYCLINTLVFASSNARESKIIHEEELNSVYENTDIPWNLLKVFLFLSFLSPIVMMVTNRVSMSSFRSLSQLQSVSHSMAVAHYAGDIRSSFLQQILNVFTYTTPICSGYSYVFANTRRYKFLCLLSVVPIILGTVITTTKLGIIAFFILFFVGYITSFISTYHKVPDISFRIFSGIIILFAALMTFFYFSFWLRIGSRGNVYETIVAKLGVYAFGHIQAFNQWFSQYAFNTEPSLGTSTFLAVSSKIFGVEKAAGVYGYISGSCSNVYTQFRQLIEDFTPGFGFLIIILVGVITTVQYRNLRNGRNTITCQLWFSINLYYILYFIISAWTYTSYILTFLMFYIFLVFTYRVKMISGTRLSFGRK